MRGFSGGVNEEGLRPMSRRISQSAVWREMMTLQGTPEQGFQTVKEIVTTNALCFRADGSRKRRNEIPGSHFFARAVSDSEFPTLQGLFEL